MARAKVKLNSAGVKALLNDPGVRAELDRRAQRVLAGAAANAPVKTGAYKAGLKIIQGEGDRAAVHIAGTAPHSALVEAKTGNLSRSLDAAGGS